MNPNKLQQAAPQPVVSNQQEPVSQQNQVSEPLQTPQPIQTDPPTTPVTPPSKFKNLLFILLAVVVVALLGTGGYVAYQRVANNNPPSPSPTPTESPDPTADWETYVNEEVGFSIQYPNKWRELVRDIETSGTGQSSEIVVLTPDPAKFDMGQIQGIFITAVDNSDKISPRDYAQRVINYQKGSLCYDTIEVSELSEVVENLDGVILTGLCGVLSQGPMLIASNGDYIVALSSSFHKENEIFGEYVFVSHELINNIYSTFQFLDSTTGSVNSNSDTACTNAGGTWNETYKECGGINEAQCKSIGGTFDECASPCRHDPNATQCILMCVQICKL